MHDRTGRWPISPRSYGRGWTGANPCTPRGRARCETPYPVSHLVIISLFVFAYHMYGEQEENVRLKEEWRPSWHGNPSMGNPSCALRRFLVAPVRLESQPCPPPSRTALLRFTEARVGGLLVPKRPRPTRCNRGATVAPRGAPQKLAPATPTPGCILYMSEEDVHHLAPSG